MIEVQMQIDDRVQVTHETPTWDDRLAAKETMMQYGKRDAARYDALWFRLLENGRPITAKLTPST